MPPNLMVFSTSQVVPAGSAKSEIQADGSKKRRLRNR